jgi:hydrogenase nickel incorporation protein HypB
MCDTRCCSDGTGHGHTVLLEQTARARDGGQAAANREWLAAREILAVNLASSPGSGRTTLLERTIRELSGDVALSVVEGDHETLFDAERIRATGARVIKVPTGADGHLDATVVATALRRLDPARRSVVFVENVGNLGCPAPVDLGEHSRVVVMSVTEGADKPVRYPHLFAAADVVLLNKTDLLPFVDFDHARFEESMARANPRASVLALSATRGAGMAEWYGWLRGRHGRSVLST